MRKEHCLVALAVTSLAAVANLNAQAVLFSDTFDRTAEAAGDTNLLYKVDFRTTGMSGSVMSGRTVSNVWLEPVDVTTPDESKSQISTNNSVLIAVGTGTSHIVLSNNFADQISTSGILSVQLTAPAWSFNDTTPLQRYLGVGIGGSLDEYTNQTVGALGNFDRRVSRVGDLFVAITQDGRVRVNDDDPANRASGNVTPTEIADLDSGSTAFVPGTLRIDLRIQDTVVGTVVPYDVYFDRGSGFEHVITNRTFTWTGFNEVYVALEGRSTVQVEADDFSITFTPQNFQPQTSLTALPDRVGENTTSNLIDLAFTASLLPPGSTYTIKADQPVSYPSWNNTGSAEYPVLPIPAVVDGTLGNVTFTIYISNTAPALVASDAVTVVAVEEAPALVTTLFGDNYDRVTLTTNDLDLDFSSTGMSGTLAPLVYLETFEGGNISSTNWNDVTSVIAYDTSLMHQLCSMANGPVMSIWGLDHNFTNAAILNDGGFSVAMEIIEINSTTGDAPDRYSGIGVGLSLDEINAFQDENGGNLQGPRGAVDGGTRHAGMADFYVSVSIDNLLQVFAGGVLMNQMTVATNRGRLRADLGITNFSAGAYVAYKVYFNDLHRREGFFQWSGNNQNYVAVSSRGSANVNIDNLEIGTVSVPFVPPAAHPDIVARLVSLAPTNPPFSSGQASFTSVTGVTYRADIADSITNVFTPAGGAVAGEAVFTATHSTATGSLDWPAAYTNSGFLKVLPVHWPGPIMP